MGKGEDTKNLSCKLWSRLTQFLPSRKSSTLDLFNEIYVCKIMQSDAGALIYVWRQHFAHVGDNRFWGGSSRHVGRNVLGGRVVVHK